MLTGLTQWFDGIESLRRWNNLPIDVWNANAVSEHVSTDYDILVEGRRPTDHQGRTGQRMYAEWGRLAWN